MGPHQIWNELLADRWATLEKWHAESREESLHLDFKAGSLESGDLRNEDKKNLAKGLSGFGNTEGGVLIFGAATQKGPTKADCLFDLAGIPGYELYAEQLRRLVQGITTPPIPGVVVEKLGHPSLPGVGIVAVLVPLTDGLPYRAEGPREVSGRYYIRSTTDTTVMPHQILAAMFGRSPLPRLRVGLHCLQQDRQEPGQVMVYVENRGRGAASHVLVRLWIEGLEDQLRRDSHLAMKAPWHNAHQETALESLNSEWHISAIHRVGYIYPDEMRMVCSTSFGHAERLVRARIDSVGAPPAMMEARVRPGSQVLWLDG